MITDYYYKTTKKRAKETIKEHDTPQDKEQLKITPLIQEKKTRQRAASASHDKPQESNSKGATDRRRLCHNRKPRSR
jgi:hypothetical protein